MPLLVTRSLTKYFGGLAAVRDLDLDINQGEIVGLIGPNGAGKTTVFNMLAGFLPSTRGRILFKDEDITSLKSNKIAEKGLVRTFQLTTLFMNLTVIQNVLIGCHRRAGIGFWQDLLRTASTRRKGRQIEEKALSVLEFVGLTNVRNEVAANLPHGHQRSLALAVALATEPEMLLLDEPFTGMNSQEIGALLECLESIRQSGVTIFLIEHNMAAAMGSCDRLVVLNYGRKIAEGKPAEIQENEQVVQAYLGPREITF